MSASAATPGIEFLAVPNSANVECDAFWAAGRDYLRGDQVAALGRLQELIARYESGNKLTELGEVLHLKALCFLGNGELVAAQRVMNELDIVASKLNSAQITGRSFLLRAIADYQRGHAEAAQDHASRACDQFRACGALTDLARAASVVGYSSVILGDQSRARKELGTAIGLAEVTGARLVEAAAEHHLGLSYFCDGRLKEAAGLYESASKIYESLGANDKWSQVAYGLVVLRVFAREIEKACELLELLKSSSIPIGLLRTFRLRLLEGLCALGRENYVKAHAVLSECLDGFRRLDSLRDLALTHEYLGDTYSGTHRSQEAIQEYTEGARIGRAISPKSDVVSECLRKEGEQRLIVGDLTGATKALRDARRASRDGGDVIEWACSLRLRGLLLLARNRDERGREYVARALLRLQDMGAYLEAHRTERLLDVIGNSRLLIDKNASVRGAARKEVAEILRAHGILSHDYRVWQSFDSIRRARASGLPVIILGETGTGKELFARSVHDLSERRGVFVSVNCAALPMELLDSELFGHSRGSFTGAMKDRPGLIEAADGGTLFLDEIGEMSLPVQGRLLRAIELGEIRRIGENATRSVQTRFVAATHRDLSKMVQDGEFRADLYFRLRGIVVTLPPLRERPGDIDLLMDHFLSATCREQGKIIDLTESAREVLRRHPWPGNVRELKSVIERIVSISDDGAKIGSSDLGLEEVRVSVSLEEHLEDEERRRLIGILESVRWNKSAAARQLKVKRTTLLGKLKRLGIVQPHHD